MIARKRLRRYYLIGSEQSLQQFWRLEFQELTGTRDGRSEDTMAIG